MKRWKMKKLRIQFKSKISMCIVMISRLEESGKVPLQSKMYTKPVDVHEPHAFGKKSTGHSVTYDPLEWNAFFDKKEMINNKSTSVAMNISQLSHG